MTDPSLLPSLASVLNWTDVSVQDLLRGYALLGVPAGLLAGMALGLLARPPASGAAAAADPWADYASFERRAVRLAHVAAVMLPALAGLFALLLDGDPSATAAARWGARLWVAGGVLLPVALCAAALRPRRAAIVVPPAVLLVAAACTLAAAGLSRGAA